MNFNGHSNNLFDELIALEFLCALCALCGQIALQRNLKSAAIPDHRWRVIHQSNTTTLDSTKAAD